MLLRELPYEALPLPAPPAHPARRVAARLLRHAGRALDDLATRLALVRPVPVIEPVLEFHADAGAPEGALYVNGQLVGHVLGVTRL